MARMAGKTPGLNAAERAPGWLCSLNSRDPRLPPLSPPENTACAAAWSLLLNNPYVVDFMGYDVFCRSGPWPRWVSRAWTAPTGTYKPIDAIASSQFAARQRGVEDGAPPPARQPAGRGDTRPNRQTERLKRPKKGIRQAIRTLMVHRPPPGRWP